MEKRIGEMMKIERSNLHEMNAAIENLFNLFLF
jgi:hypothetical protein